MRENLDYCLGVCTQFEGGFVNHPRDPGGATNHGITIHTLKAYRRRSVTVEDVRQLTLKEARQIYVRNYWTPIRGDDLPSGLDLSVFDYAINSGPSRAVKCLQEIVGAAPDGILGDKTLEKVETYVEKYGIDRLIDRYNETRLNFVRKLNTFSTFGRGWTIRITGKDPLGKYREQPGIDDLSKRLAHRVPRSGAVIASADAPMPVPMPEVTDAGKARDADIVLASTDTGKLQWTAVAGSVAAAAGEIGEMLTPYATTLKWIGLAATACTIIVIIANMSLTLDRLRGSGTQA